MTHMHEIRNTLMTTKKDFAYPRGSNAQRNRLAIEASVAQEHDINTLLAWSGTSTPSSRPCFWDDAMGCNIFRLDPQFYARLCALKTHTYAPSPRPRPGVPKRRRRQNKSGPKQKRTTACVSHHCFPWMHNCCNISMQGTWHHMVSYGMLSYHII